MLRSLFTSVLLAVMPLAASAHAEPPLQPFAGDWDRHGFGLTVADDGSSHAAWRIYVWCDQGPPPCDSIENGNYLRSGGQADIAFSNVTDQDAEGEVLNTTDPSGLDVGPVTLSLMPYDMASLRQGDHEIVLCGVNFSAEAPEDLASTYPCGA